MLQIQEMSNEVTDEKKKCPESFEQRQFPNSTCSKNEPSSSSIIDSIDELKTGTSSCAIIDTIDECEDDDVERNSIHNFAVIGCTTLSTIRATAKRFGLVVTRTRRKVGNDSSNQDRIGFGLSNRNKRHLERVLNTPIKQHLFGFNMRRDGLYHPVDRNRENLDRYLGYLSILNKNEDGLSSPTFGTRLPRKVWRKEDIATLIEARCEPSPPTFKNIARELNRTYQRLGLQLDRPFTERNCRDRWTYLFPSSDDTSRTMEYIRELKKVWPDMMYHPEVETSSDLDGPPKLIALHLVFPWSRKMMTRLSPSIFCDATYNVTIYSYKVVGITTLDGNKQHRPLMISFISNCTGDQWCTIFNMFSKHIIRDHSVFYVITSDQEEAINAGLELSQLRTTSVHFICSLHQKWNVRSHK